MKDELVVLGHMRLPFSTLRSFVNATTLPDMAMGCTRRFPGRCSIDGGISLEIRIVVTLASLL